jgi:hypothetical protein
MAGERICVNSFPSERSPGLARVYCGWKAAMALVNLAEAISSLTPEEQESVRLFIEFLKRRESAPSPFLAAVNEFVAQHPELLRRLAE